MKHYTYTEAINKIQFLQQVAEADKKIRVEKDKLKKAISFARDSVTDLHMENGRLREALESIKKENINEGVSLIINKALK